MVGDILRPMHDDRDGAPRVVVVHNRRSSFVRTDLDLLAERYRVVEVEVPRGRLRAATALAATARADVVVGWFASLHTLTPFLASRLLHRPSLIVASGYDVARVPEIGYGSQLGGARRAISRATLRCATVVVASSEFNATECVDNAGVPRGKVRRIFCAVDPGAPIIDRPRQGVLTVGDVADATLRRKGLRLVVQAARLLPNIPFTVAGAWIDRSAADELRAIAGANVHLTGRLTDEQLRDAYDSADVYVQASLHEGFGVAVAEAMARGCAPVLSPRGALPEVGGPDAVYVEELTPEALAAAIGEATLRAGAQPSLRERWRQRVVDTFPVERRRRCLHALVDALIERHPAPADD